jgi:hypothetical protein
MLLCLCERSADPRQIRRTVVVIIAPRAFEAVVEILASLKGECIAGVAVVHIIDIVYSVASALVAESGFEIYRDHTVVTIVFAGHLINYGGGVFFLGLVLEDL